MTESRARRDLDFNHVLDDPDDNDGWYGQAQAAEPTSMHEVDYVERDELPENGRDYADPDTDPDTDRWHLQAQAAEPVSTTEIEHSERDVAHDNDWDDARESRWDGLYAPRNDRNGTPRIGEWTFSVSRREPWYRSKHVRTALIAAAVAAIAVPVVLLAMRGPAPGIEESTTVSPQAPTSEPAPTSTAPALSTAMPSPPAPPPPPVPPPPPPPADTGPAPVITRQYPQPRQSAPEQTDKPEIGVTRTPATRAPISAKPPPPPRSGNNSGAPGDGTPGGGWNPW
jgi:hypothetical protein